MGKSETLIAVGILIVFLAVNILAINPQFSPPNCGDNQIIMRLSNTTNAHGALWNDNKYNIQVCFSNIFGFNYVPDANENPHACNTNNSVLNLTNISNSHAGKRDENNFETQICYGNLKCILANETETCSDLGSEFKEVIRLSDKKDAHLSIEENYDFKVCCKTEQNQGPLGCNNNNICNINEDCQCSDCHGFKDSCSSSNNLTCDYHTNSCQPCPSRTAYSSSSGTCEPDSPPQILIVKPEKAFSSSNWKKYKIDSEFPFEQISSNLRKDLSISWNFRDGNTSIYINCLTSGNCNTTHKYSTHGHYTVNAIANEQGGSRSASDHVDFLVYRQELNVFAIITQPSYGAAIPSGQATRFNANESFVAECFSSSTACTQASFNIPCYQVGDLSCYNLPRPGESGFSNFDYEFFFNWTFDRETDSVTSLYGKWNDQYSQVVNYEKIFTGSQGSNHTAQLIVKYRK